jgi:hypothetical protein
MSGPLLTEGMEADFALLTSARRGAVKTGKLAKCGSFSRGL